MCNSEPREIQAPLELLECPFCEKSRGKLFELNTWNHVDEVVYYVECLSCGSRGPSGHTSSSEFDMTEKQAKEEAVLGWNAALRTKE